MNQDILALRAKKLAEQVQKETDVGELTTFLEFMILNSRYAVHLDKVVAVRRVEEILSIPMTAPHISGVIQYKGQSIALINLPRFFYPTRKGIEDADYAVIVVAKQKRFAIQIEDIIGVRQFGESELLPPPSDLKSKQAQFISLVTNDGGAIIDIEKLIDADDFAVI